MQTAAQGLLLEVERKSGTLSHLAAMQLSSLCSAHPEAASSYKACFCKLLLEGAPDADSDCAMIGDPGAPPGSEEAAILPVLVQSHRLALTSVSQGLETS